MHQSVSRALAVGLLFAATLATSGCSSVPWWARLPGPDTTHRAGGAAGSHRLGGRDAAAPVTLSERELTRNEDRGNDTASPRSESSASPESPELKAFIAELEEYPEISLADRNELLQHLHQTKPALLEGVIRQYRASLAFRRRQKEKKRELAGKETTTDAARAETHVETRQQPSPVAVADPKPPSPSPPAVDLPEAEPKQSTSAAVLAAIEMPPQSQASRSAAKQVIPDGRAADPPKLSIADRLMKRVRPPRDKSKPQVVPACFETKLPSDWQDQLTATIGTLESSVNEEPESPDEISDHARLRLLLLAAQRRDDALRPIPSLEPEMTEFWNKEVFGLATLLDTGTISDPVQRISEAKLHFEEAACRLGEAAPLVVRNMAFITKVVSYGVYTPFESYEFTPDQRVGLYVEIDNFTSKEGPQGFRTSLKSSYQVLDNAGHRVSADEFDPNLENCRNRRRDYFIYYELNLPKRIYPGEYTLQLTVTDNNSKKVGQSTVQFYVRDESRK